MSTTSKSPRKVAIQALRIGERILAPYSNRFSPKTFTQPQLLACLALKLILITNYRGITAYLRDMPGLCETLRLKRVPHYTTLQKAVARLLQLSTVRDFLETTARIGLPSRNGKIIIETAAADSTGFESGQISPYFVQRRARGKKTLEKQDYQTISRNKKTPAAPTRNKIHTQHLDSVGAMGDWAHHPSASPRSSHEVSLLIQQSQQPGIILVGGALP